MNTNYLGELTPKQQEKTRKNLVFIGCISICMLFAGFTSAYIVSKGGSFWVGFPLPNAFYISTLIIIFSSIVLQLGVNKALKGNRKLLNFAVPFTLLCGILFAYFQFQGYAKMTGDGAHAVNRILVSEGRYGDHFELKMNGKYMEVDGNDYFILGKKINETSKKEIADFAQQFDSVSYTSKIPVANKKFQLLYHNQVINYKNGDLYMQDTMKLGRTDLIRLESFMMHLRDSRGDFYHRGKYGKDFWISFQGVKLQYKERELYLGSKKIDGPMQLKASVSADQATTYLYIITFLHLLHILVTLIYFAKKTIHSFSGKISELNFIGIRTGAIFWHFLGGLWLFLLCFLLFIH